MEELKNHLAHLDRVGTNTGGLHERGALIDAWMRLFENPRMLLPFSKAAILRETGHMAAQGIATAGIWTAGQLGDWLELLFTGKTENKASKGAKEAIRQVDNYKQHRDRTMQLVGSESHKKLQEKKQKRKDTKGNEHE